MRLVVAVVGKPRDPHLRELIQDYETRAARYWPLEVHQVREEKAGANAESLVRERESLRLEEKLPPRCRTFACDGTGERRTSEQFARLLQDARESAQDLAFVIGGAYGLGETLLRRAEAKLALAPWTLPHELARLVLAEQIYRAGTIVRREPYHK